MSYDRLAIVMAMEERLMPRKKVDLPPRFEMVIDAWRLSDDPVAAVLYLALSEGNAEFIIDRTGAQHLIDELNKIFGLNVVPFKRA